MVRDVRQVSYVDVHVLLHSCTHTHTVCIGIHVRFSLFQIEEMGGVGKGVASEMAKLRIEETDAKKQSRVDSGAGAMGEGGGGRGGGSRGGSTGSKGQIIMSSHCSPACLV